jgi:hypothetical protein
MKWTTDALTAQTTVKQPTILGKIITERIRLYEQLNWLTDVTEADIETLINEAESTEQRIVAAGLNPKPHGVYRIGIIPACFAAIHPHYMRKTLRDLLGQTDVDDWGYVNTNYYGDTNEPRNVLHGFTYADMGKVFFLVEDIDAPGHNPKMPGSLLADMYWGKERDKAWTEWKLQYETAGTVKALNFALHSLIWLGDINDWNNALGRIGYYDYIEQPYDPKQLLCPFGSIHIDAARWSARDSGADATCAIAPVVW